MISQCDSLWMPSLAREVEGWVAASVAAHKGGAQHVSLNARHRASSKPAECCGGVALHPGATDTALSRPFQCSVRHHSCLRPVTAARACRCTVNNSCTPECNPGTAGVQSPVAGGRVSVSRACQVVLSLSGPSVIWKEPGWHENHPGDPSVFLAGEPEGSPVTGGGSNWLTSLRRFRCLPDC